MISWKQAAFHGGRRVAKRRQKRELGEERVASRQSNNMHGVLASNRSDDRENTITGWAGCSDEAAAGRSLVSGVETADRPAFQAQDAGSGKVFPTAGKIFSVSQDTMVRSWIPRAHAAAW